MSNAHGPRLRRVTPTQDGRALMRSRAEVVAWKCSLRLASIPALSGRLSGAALEEAKDAIEAELALAFHWGGSPKE